MTPNCLTCDDFDCQLNPAQDPEDRNQEFHIRFARARVVLTGCLSHPNAREYLNKAVIQELKTSIKSWNENLQPSDDYECGIIAGMEVAISLLKGVKE